MIRAWWRRSIYLRLTTTWGDVVVAVLVVMPLGLVAGNAMRTTGWAWWQILAAALVLGLSVGLVVPWMLARLRR